MRVAGKRRRPHKEKAPTVRIPKLVLAAIADLDHIVEAPRRDHGRARQAACDQRVSGDRGAVRDESQLARVEAGGGDAVEHREVGILRRGRYLAT